MFKQPTGKEALLQFLSWIVCAYLVIFFLVGCTDNFSIPASTSTTPVASTPTATVAPAVFEVTSIDMTVQPKSIVRMACGTAITVVYTATFHLAARGPGGTMHFYYTKNNGRATGSASVNVKPGQTIATYAFSWSGNLPADHTYPGLGGVMMTSPASMVSPFVQPDGRCV